MLNRESILSGEDLPREEVFVPEWSGSVYVRAMTGFERDLFETQNQREKSANIRARLAALTVCDERGKALFTQSDVGALGSKSGLALDRIFDAAIRLNAIGQAAEKLAGESKASPGSDSSTGSP
jgi:hypothetical protein